jgi:serine/threonine protein kinase
LPFVVSLNLGQKPTLRAIDNLALLDFLRLSSTMEEKFDEEGNVLSVGHYEFMEGILGRGAYGTVRLAKRTGETPISMGGAGTPLSSSEHNRRRRKRNTLHHAATFSPAPTYKEYDDEAEDEGVHDIEIFRKSSSAPYGFDPFGGLSTPERTPHAVVGQFGFIVRQGLQKASSHIGSFFEDDEDSCKNDLVAIKIYHKSLLKTMRTMERDKDTRKMKVHTALEQVEKEIALMKKMHHPNLVAMYEVIDSPESDLLYMVLEYMPLGEIITYQDDGTFLRKGERIDGYNAKLRHFEEDTAALFFVDILHGLGYLHRHGVVHRDLKPENIL